MSSDFNLRAPPRATESANGDTDSFISAASKIDSVFGDTDKEPKAKSTKTPQPSSDDINLRNQGPFDYYLEIERPRIVQPQQQIDDFGPPLIEQARTKSEIEVANKRFPEQYDRHTEAYKFDNHPETAHHKLLNPVRRGAFGRNGEACNIATNHYHMNLSTANWHHATQTKFYEYTVQALPGHDGVGPSVHLQALPTVHKKAVISAAIRLLKERQKRSLSGLATDYDHVLLSLTPLYDSGNTCILKVTVNAHLHPSGDFRVILKKNGKWGPDISHGLTQGRAIVPFAGSKNQYLLDQLTFRQISSSKMLSVGHSEFLGTEEHIALTQDGPANGLRAVRTYGANAISGTQGFLLRIVIRGSPMLGCHRVADLLAQVGHNATEADRSDACNKVAAALKGSLLHVDSRPSDIDNEEQIVRQHLNETLECDKVFQHLGDADPKFTRQWREKGKPKTKCMGEYLEKHKLVSKLEHLTVINE
jgi:hypothetical protein